MSVPVPLAVPPILLAFPDAVLAFDPADRVVGWNPAAERLYGLPDTEAVGQSVLLVVPRKRQRPWVRACEAVRAGGQWAGELTTLSASGLVRQVDARWAVGADGVIVCVHAEVGDRRRADARDRRADRWAAVRGLAGAAAAVLPACPARELLAAAGAGADPVADGRLFHGAGAWVLVAAADPLVRELARAVLDAAGYTVVPANDPSGASRAAADHQDKLRAAVLGFGADTPAVGRDVQRHRPHLPVVPVGPGLDPAGLLRAAAEAVGRDLVFDPDSDVY